MAELSAALAESHNDRLSARVPHHDRFLLVCATLEHIARKLESAVLGGTHGRHSLARRRDERLGAALELVGDRVLVCQLVVGREVARLTVDGRALERQKGRLDPLDVALGVVHVLALAQELVRIQNDAQVVLASAHARHVDPLAVQALVVVVAPSGR